MTRKRYMNATCPDCGEEAICPKCQKPVAMSTPFSDWLRSLTGPLSSKVFSAQNLDYIWHNYKENWFITIEEKRFGGNTSFAQRDTHMIVSGLLKAASGANVKNARGKFVDVEYRGHYVIRFSQTTPDDSEAIYVEHDRESIRVRKGELLELLGTGVL